MLSEKAPKVDQTPLLASDLPFTASLVDGVWHVEFKSDVVFNYRGTRTDLVSNDHVTAVGGDSVNVSGGVYHYNPYDLELLYTKFRASLSDNALHSMLEMASERQREEVKNLRQEARRRFYWEAAQRRKYGPSRKKCGCHD